MYKMQEIELIVKRLEGTKTKKEKETLTMKA